MIGASNPHIRTYTTPKLGPSDTVTNINFYPVDPARPCPEHVQTPSACANNVPIQKYAAPFRPMPYVTLLRHEVEGRWARMGGKMHLVNSDGVVNTLSDAYVRRMGIDAADDTADEGSTSDSIQPAGLTAEQRAELALKVAQPPWSDEQVWAFVEQRVKGTARASRHYISCALCLARGYAADCGFVCPALEAEVEAETARGAQARPELAETAAQGEHARTEKGAEAARGEQAQPQKEAETAVQGEPAK